MLISSNVRLLLMPIVLSFGLVSCSSDTKNEKKLDQWVRPKVTVVKNGDVSALKDANDLKLSDEIRFEFDDKVMEETITTLDVMGSCTTANHKDPMKFEYKIEKSPAFKFIDSFSDQILFNSEKEMTCAFSVKITNQNGSTKTYDVERVRIARTEEDQLFLIAGTQKFSGTITSSVSKKLKFQNRAKKGDLTFQCQNFQTTLKVDELSKVSLADVALIPVAGGVEDPRRTQPKQTCRAIFRSTDHAKTTTISAVLNFDYSFYPLEIRVKNVTSNPGGALSGKFVFQVYTIENINDDSVTVAIPNDGVLTAYVQGKYMMDTVQGAGVTDMALDEPISLEVSDGTVRTRGSQKMITLAAGESTTISLTVTPRRICGRFQGDIVGLGSRTGTGVGIVITVKDPTPIKLVVSSQLSAEAPFVPYYEEKLWSRSPSQGNAITQWFGNGGQGLSYNAFPNYLKCL